MMDTITKDESAALGDAHLHHGRIVLGIVGRDGIAVAVVEDGIEVIAVLVADAEDEVLRPGVQRDLEVLIGLVVERAAAAEDAVVTGLREGIGDRFELVEELLDVFVLRSGAPDRKRAGQREAGGGDGGKTALHDASPGMVCGHRRGEARFLRPVETFDRVLP